MRLVFLALFLELIALYHFPKRENNLYTNAGRS